ncbi:RNA-directed DNA polymerase (Reverse transcriptase) [Trifolium medium]|uniref:RNA-directed DNA polymerase (Reverse transcriptase) n=1 Tax=Trifolium medium TaxID=97028 RepID=A0A392MJX5_9FABA|nr:RNA-directed DNA polymerase (Reverse transcriptase) [Trifolium medium]
MLTLMPFELEIHDAVFSMNKNSAPGPDGFGAFFFRSYWGIIKHDVSMAVMEFFSSGCLMPNMNANTLVLIPKSPDADTIDKYCPIAMANFKFKIISKIIADRLARIMPNIISKQQRGFIQGRQIKECVCLTSEAISLLHNKAFGGNLALKIDISKAFDTLDWGFLLKVLHDFGFNSTFFSEGKVDLIKGARGNHVSSYIFYAYDIMIFCKGKISSLEALRDLFSTYAHASGQSISAEKSTIHAGSIPSPRLSQLVNYLGFKVGTLPFTYLGVPIFKGRAQLIKSVIFGMLMHTISIYSWPASLIKEVEQLIRNFLWSGDISKRKMVTVAWKKSNEDWANLLKSRVIRNGSTVTYHIFSSIWTGGMILTFGQTLGVANP